MAVRRTKTEKQLAQAKRFEVIADPTLHVKFQYRADATVTRATKSAQAEKTQSNWQSLFGYDVKFIYRDLLKTVIFTILLVSGLVGVWLMWR